MQPFNEGTTPFTWHQGTGDGPFTVDNGGGLSQAMSGTSTAPVSLGPSSLAHHQNNLPAFDFGLLSSSFPAPASAPNDWAAAVAAASNAASSFGGAPSPFAAAAAGMQPSSSGSGNMFNGLPSSVPASMFMPAPNGVQSPQPQFDSSLFALQMSLASSLASSAAPSTTVSPIGSPVDSPKLGSMPAPSSRNSKPQGSGPIRSNSRRGSNMYVSSARSTVPGSRPHLGMSNLSNTAPAIGSPLASPLNQLSPSADPTFGGMFLPDLRTHQRPVPPLPRSSPANAIVSGSAPVSAHASPMGSPMGSPRQSHMRASSVAQPVASTSTPPVSRPPTPPKAAPKAPVNFDFASLEHDLDQFTSSGGFATAAAAAMANFGPNGRTVNATGNYNVGGYAPPGPLSPPADDITSPKVIASVLSDSVYSHLPPRSPAASQSVMSPIDFSAFVTDSPDGSPAGTTATTHSGDGGSASAGYANDLSGSTRASPSGYAAADSPRTSALFDDDGFGEPFSKKDPIAAQMWRMFNKAKNTLPNGARMENLTWRLMSMSLKKKQQREGSATPATEPDESAFKRAMDRETARAEGDVVIGSSNVKARDFVAGSSHEDTQDVGAREAAEEAAEAENEVQELRRRRSFKKHAVSRQPAASSTRDEEEDRGRRGRSTTSGSKSASNSASPESQEQDDFMDWRAKSQSRSRSRAPDVMDWRAQSRSRSRAPDLRVAAAAPTVDVATATANFSRFYGDGSGKSTPSTSSAVVDDPRGAHAQLAASLGLAPADIDSLEKAGINFAALTSSVASPAAKPAPIASTASPSNSVAKSPPFAFQAGSASPKNSAHASNLAAIESTLNQLISLQSLATSSGGSSTSSTVKHSGSSSSLAQQSTKRAQASLAQQQLQQQLQQLSALHGVSRPPAQEIPTEMPTAQPVAPARSQACGQSTLSAASSTSTSPNASGLSLNRPANLLPEFSASSTSAAFFSEPPTPFTFPASAPLASTGFLHSPSASVFGDQTPDTNFGLYDYFTQAPEASSGYASPFLSTSVDAVAPGYINPTHLYNSLQQHTGGFDESFFVGGSIDVSQNNTPSPATLEADLSEKLGIAASRAAATTAASRKPKSASAAAKIRGSMSTGDLVGLGQAAVRAKPPPSRIASKQNGIPATVHEGKPLGTPGANEEDANAVKCINCSTTNTPLWRRDAEGRPLCNACGLFRNLHGVDRPATLNTGVIKKRNRNRNKDPTTKKTSSSNRTGRRNSMGASPPSSTGTGTRPIARAGAPYPPTASRSVSASNANSPTA